jgi:hypothetical protein
MYDDCININQHVQILCTQVKMDFEKALASKQKFRKVIRKLQFFCHCCTKIKLFYF